MRLPFGDILHLRKEKTALLIDNAIAICTSDGAEFLFRSFWERDICFNLLDEYWERSGGAADPPLPNFSLFADEMQALSFQAEQLRRSRSQSHPEKALTLEPFFIEKTITPSPSMLRRSLSRSRSSFSRSMSADQLNDLLVQSLGVAAAPVPLPPASPPSYLKIGGLPSEASSLMFEQCCSEAKLANKVVSDIVLPLSLADFFANFLADDAPCSTKTFQLSMQELDVICSPWSSSDSSIGTSLLTRKVEFLKPINVLGITNTRAYKEQSLHLFPGKGLVQKATTRLDEKSAVPAATYFEVHDMLCLKELDAESISLSIAMEVKFVKSTMFRFAIESNTIRETVIYLKRYVDFLKEQVGLLMKSRGPPKLDRLKYSAAVILDTAVAVLAPTNLSLNLSGAAEDPVGVGMAGPDMPLWSSKQNVSLIKNVVILLLLYTLTVVVQRHTASSITS